MRRSLVERPWLLVVLAFVVLVGAWVALIIVAERNKPEAIPVPPTRSSP